MGRGITEVAGLVVSGPESCIFFFFLSGACPNGSTINSGKFLGCFSVTGYAGGDLVSRTQKNKKERYTTRQSFPPRQH